MKQENETFWLSERVAKYQLVINSPRGIGWCDQALLEKNLGLPAKLVATGESKQEVIAALKLQVFEADLGAVKALEDARPLKHRSGYSGNGEYRGLATNAGGNFRRCGDCGFQVGPVDPTCVECGAYVCLMCASCGCKHSKWNKVR